MVDLVSGLFVFLYEIILQYRDPIYRLEIFDFCGWLCLLVIPLLGLIAYYYVAGWFYAKYNSRRDYSIALLITATVSAITAYVYSFVISGTSLFNPEVLVFTLSNFIYSIVFFVVLSFVVKWWSPNSKCTPF